MFDEVGKWYAGVLGGKSRTRKSKSRSNPAITEHSKVFGLQQDIASVLHKYGLAHRNLRYRETSVGGLEISSSRDAGRTIGEELLNNERAAKAVSRASKALGFVYLEGSKVLIVPKSLLVAMAGPNSDTRRNPRRRSRYPLFVIQTIEVSKTHSKAKARAIAIRHGGQPGGKVDETKNYWRFRQHDPKLMTKRYVSLRLPSAIIVKALPKSVARRAKVSNSTKPLTQAELKRLWALQDTTRTRKNPMATPQELQAKIEAWLEKKHLSYGVNFYSQEKWNSRGETVGKGALLHMTAEGDFNHAYNYGETASDRKATQQFQALVEKAGYFVEQGHSWSWHFYVAGSVR